jgi:membrane associated rhomboid family serine protease
VAHIAGFTAGLALAIVARRAGPSRRLVALSRG